MPNRLVSAPIPEMVIMEAMAMAMAIMVVITVVEAILLFPILTTGRTNECLIFNAHLRLYHQVRLSCDMYFGNLNYVAALTLFFGLL